MEEPENKSQFKIDKNIPVPPAYRKSKYPFNIMVKGDSFFVEDYSREKMSNLSTAGRAYFRAMKRPFTVCTSKEGKGFRVWMIDKKDKK